MKEAPPLIRVLVIDLDSPLRDALVAFWESCHDVAVVGVGGNGRDAARLAQRLRPTVITMGTSTLSSSGVQAIRQIMRTVPTPIIVISEAAADGCAAMCHYAFEALQAGALAVVNEPRPSQPDSYIALLDTVRLMSGVPVIHHWERKVTSAYNAPCAILNGDWNARMHQVDIIGIAASTGGPGALTTLLRALPADFAVPIVLVQHVIYGFAVGFADWLDTQTPLRVQIATAAMLPESGAVLLSPDDYHLQLNRLGKIELHQQAPYKGLRPSANYLFASLAEAYGPRAMGIVLTGMGDDGADGLVQLHRRGGLTIAQDEQSSVVYGMPQQALNRQAVDKVLGLEEIAETLRRKK